MIWVFTVCIFSIFNVIAFDLDPNSVDPDLYANCEDPDQYQNIDPEWSQPPTAVFGVVTTTHSSVWSGHYTITCV